MYTAHIILPILLIVLCLVSYKYIHELETCSCFQENKTDKVNLEYIKFYLLLYVFSILVHILLLLMRKRSFKMGNGIVKSLVSLSVLIIVLIHAYMGYMVYHFLSIHKRSLLMC